MNEILKTLKKCKTPQDFSSFGESLATTLNAYEKQEQLKAYQNVGKPLNGEQLKHLIAGINKVVKDKNERSIIFDNLMGLVSIQTYVDNRLGALKNLPQTAEVQKMIEGANKLKEIQNKHKKS